MYMVIMIFNGLKTSDIDCFHPQAYLILVFFRSQKKQNHERMKKDILPAVLKSNKRET